MRVKLLNGSDPETKEALQPWIDTARVIGDRPIGTSAVLLESARCYLGECNIGSFLTDAMVYEVSSLHQITCRDVFYPKNLIGVSCLDILLFVLFSGPIYIPLQFLIPQVVYCLLQTLLISKQ